jgi:uncharacterized protein
VRIVLDTNVVLSALLWRGTPYRLLGLIRQQSAIELFTSAALLQELDEVLSRPVATARLALVGRSARDLLVDYAEIAEVVVPTVTPRVIIADPDDDEVIAAAVTAGADLIVSGDRHLLALGVYQGIRIVAPAEAFRLVPSA